MESEKELEVGEAVLAEQRGLRLKLSVKDS